MSQHYYTNEPIPNSVNTFERLAHWIEKKTERVRTDLRTMFDDLVEQGEIAEDRDYLSGPIGSLGFFNDHLEKSKLHQNPVLSMATLDLVDEFRQQVMIRFAGVTCSHVHEISQTYPGLQLRVEMGINMCPDSAGDIDFFLSRGNGVKFRSEMFQEAQGDNCEYPGVFERVEVIREAFKSCLKQDVFPSMSHRIDIAHRIFLNRKEICPEFLREIMENRVHDIVAAQSWTADEIVSLTLEFINEFSSDQLRAIDYAEFMESRAEARNDMDAEMPEESEGLEGSEASEESEVPEGPD